MRLNFTKKIVILTWLICSYSMANADNIFALFSSPNDKIMKSFTDNFK